MFKRILNILLQVIQCDFRTSVSLSRSATLPIKRLGSKRGVGLGRVSSNPPCGFLKIVSSKQSAKPWFFMTFKIIIEHIFLENFIEILQVVQKLWITSLSILAIFINFYHFFGFFHISLLQRN